MKAFIEYVGKHTQSVVAKDLGVSQGAISQWIANGEIPIKRVRKVEQLTGIPAAQLHSDFEGSAAA